MPADRDKNGKLYDARAHDKSFFNKIKLIQPSPFKPLHIKKGTWIHSNNSKPIHVPIDALGINISINEYTVSPLYLILS